MSKLLKKITVIALAFTMMSLCACGETAQQTETPSTEPTEEKVIKTTEAEEERYKSEETAEELLARLADTEMIDIRDMTCKQLVSEQYLLHMTVLHDIMIVDGEIYYIQKIDSAPGDCVIQHLGEDGLADSYMSLINFGQGMCVNAEKAADGSIYFWVESNTNISSEGQTLSRIKWEPGKVYNNQGGQTWYFGQTDGSPYAAIDSENGLVCVRTNCNAGYRFSYYCLQDMIDGKNPEPIYEMETALLTSTLDTSINPDKIGVGDYAFHGFAISGKYIYQYFGKATQAISIAVYDMEGNAQYVYKLKDYADLVYREPDGMCIADGQLYIGITSGESSDRRANVFVFE